MVKKSIWQLVSKDREKYLESNRVKKKKFRDHYVKQIAVETIRTKKIKKKRDEREIAQKSL